MKLPFLIYTDLECLLEKMSICQNNPNKSSTTKINKFKNTYSFCNDDLNKFILLLRKGVYPSEYIDS